jgi:type VI secretion system protein ImpJ
MKFLSRVVWSEGMYLGPQQFQAQSRYFEDSLQFTSNSLNYRPYGLTGCKLDADALRNGTVSVVHARGLFADGLAFHMPEGDLLPPPRPIADLFPPTRESLTIRLAIPTRRPTGANCAINGVPVDSRYVAEMRNFADESTGNDERPVQVGQKRLRLVLDTEPQEGLTSLAIARVIRDGAGHYIFDPDFIPPCLHVSASERLLVLLRQLLELLEEKSATLGGRGTGKTNDYAPRDLAAFWLLHSVNSAAAVLRHLWTSKRGHPEEVFLELSRLAGALCTFGQDSHPRTLPLYDHDDPTECFNALERHIRTHLEIILPTNCLEIRLEQTANYFYEGPITDSRCLGRSRWVLGIRSDAGEIEVISRAPQLVKVCSSKFVGELVKRALAGLELTHLPVPPPAVKAKVETQYFAINRSGPFWDHIVQTRRIGVYVPGELPNPELELFVVLD